MLCRAKIKIKIKKNYSLLPAAAKKQKSHYRYRKQIFLSVLSRDFFLAWLGFSFFLSFRGTTVST